MRSSLEWRAVSPVIWECLASLPFLFHSPPIILFILALLAKSCSILWVTSHAPSLQEAPLGTPSLVRCPFSELRQPWAYAVTAPRLSPPLDCEFSEGKDLHRSCFQPVENNGCGWLGRTSCAAGTVSPDTPVA